MSALSNNQGHTPSRLWSAVVGQQGETLPSTYEITANAQNNTVIRPAPLPAVERLPRPQPPTPPELFHDRLDEQLLLVEHLQPGQVVWLTGPPGCGVSSLLRTVANLPETTALPDGVVYLTADDVPAMPIAHCDDVIQRVFDCFYRGRDAAQRVRVSLETAQSYLEKIQALIVLDDLSLDSDDLMRLCDAFPQSAVCIAAATTPPDLSSPTLVCSLGPLPERDAVVLWAKTAQLDEEDTTLRPRLIRACAALGGLPLPIVLGAQLVRSGRVSLDQLLAVLEKVAVTGLPLAHMTDLVIKTLRVEEQTTLRALLGAGALAIDLEALAMISQRPPATLRPRLERLEELGLVRSVDNRYAIASNSLRRALKAHLPTPVEQVRAAYFFAAMVPVLPGSRSELERMLGSLVTAAQTARDTGLTRILGTLVRGMQPVLVEQGLWASWEQICAWAEQAADATDDMALRAWALHERGTRAGLLADQRAAAEALDQARRLRLALGDEEGAAASQQNLVHLRTALVSPVAAEPAPSGPVRPRTGKPRRARWLVPGAVGSALLIVLTALLAFNRTPGPPTTSNAGAVSATGPGTAAGTETLARSTFVPTDTATPLPTVAATPALSLTQIATFPTATPVPTTLANTIFTTLPVGASLPSGDECAQRVRRSLWEPRPANAEENAYVPVPAIDYSYTITDVAQIVHGGDYAPILPLIDRVDGNFTGTTDEIIQWGACKWGFDEDQVRAVAVQESYWRMSTVGDNGESFGLLQVRAPVYRGTYPASERSTAFNVDFALAVRRACYEGHITWLGPEYRAGDNWGCTGFWYSGRWYGEAAQWYIGEVQNHLANRTWEQFDFLGGDG